MLSLFSFTNQNPNLDKRDSGEEADRPTALGGQIRATASGLCEPAAGERSLQQAPASEERRADRAELCALLRYGGNEKDASARTPEHSQATIDSRRGV